MPNFEQMEFDFSGKPISPNRPSRKEHRLGRPHHRTTMITTTRKMYERVRSAEDFEEIQVSFCNDIISSAKGGSSVVHHAVRRVDLLRRQISGGFTKVRVRCEQGEDFVCFLVSDVEGASDDCIGKVWVSKSLPKSVATNR